MFTIFNDNITWNNLASKFARPEQGGVNHSKAFLKILRSDAIKSSFLYTYHSFTQSNNDLYVRFSLSPQ